MTRTATVNYHVTSPDRQAFHIDAGGITGRLLSPQLAPTEVPVRDERSREVAVHFALDGIGFASMPSAISDFSGEDWRPVYDAELTRLLTSELGAQEVVVFDHTLRIDDPESPRKPARNVHSDYSPTGARQRLTDILGDSRAAQWDAGHYAFVNVWRPVGTPINTAPLGFVRPASVATEDWIEIDLIYPDRTGQIMGLVASGQHEWIYRSRMTPDEVAYFNIHDNQRLPTVGHSALDLTEDPQVRSPRKSIESRTIVRY